MFTTIQQAIDYVTSKTRTNQQKKLFNELLVKYDNPQLKLKTIHVAGTNGKGSTTNYLRSILQAAGYKVGSFTSPHLITHLDRIRINDEYIDGDYFLNFVNQHYDEFQEYDLTMFEMDTFISFMYFLDKKVDIAVYEVGMGGRLDPTNVINPIGAVITNIEMDHMAILGDTIGKIAYEKAGIIKKNLPVVTFEEKQEALEVFADKVKQERAEIIHIKSADNIKISDHIEFNYKDHHITLPTIAQYQVLNSSAAVELIDVLNQRGLIKVSEEQLLKGLDTFWQGRFEIVHHSPTVIIDGAHNENGIDKLCQSIDNLKEEVVIVFSALKDKEYHSMLVKLTKKGKVIVTQFENKRSTTAENLAYGLDVEVIEDYQQAINKALKMNKTVIITGSLYFISIVRELFVNK